MEKTYLITGGTRSLGKALTRHILDTRFDQIKKFKHFVAQITSKKGSLDVLGKKNIGLERIIDLLQLR